MAITGTFLADFTAFEAAVKKAEVSLKGMETGAGKVETSLNRMVDSFSGRKVVQDATLMTEAVERIGGASKLTEAEQQKVNRAVTEAIEKYRALQQEAPEALLKLAAATKQVQSPMDQLKAAASSTLGALGIAFTGAAVIGGIKNLIGGTLEYASQVKFLGDKLDISYEATQRFITAGKQSGTTMEVVGAAIAKMNLELGQGGTGTIKALKDAGLEFSQIKSLKSEDSFRAITAAIEGIEDPLVQARVAVELFGKSGQDLLPAIRDGFNEAADAARVMSDETIKRLEAAKQTWENFGDRVTIVTGELMSDVGKAWTVGLGRVLNVAQDFWSGTEIGFHENREKIVEDAQKLVEEVNAQFAKLIKGTATPAGLLPGLTSPGSAGADAVLALSQKMAEADKAAADDARKHTDAIRALLAEMSGANEAQKARDIAEAWRLATVSQRAAIVTHQGITAAIRNVGLAAGFAATNMGAYVAAANALAGVRALTQRELGDVDFSSFQAQIQSGLSGRVAAFSGNDLAAMLPNIQAYADGLGTITAATQDASVGQSKWNDAMAAADILFGAVGGTYGQIGQQILGIVQSYKVAADAAETSAARQAAAANMAMGVYGLVIQAMIHQARNSIEEFRAMMDSIHAQQVEAWERAVISGEEYIDVFGRLITQEMIALKLQQQINLAVNGTGQEAEDAQAELQKLFDTFREGNDDASLWTDEFLAFINEMKAGGASVDGMAEALATQQRNAAEGIKAALAVSGAAWRQEQDDVKKLGDLKAQMAAIDAQRAALVDTGAGGRDEARINELDRQWDDLHRQVDALNHDLGVQQSILRATSIDTVEEANAASAAIMGDVAARLDAGESWIAALRDQKDAVADLAAAMDAGGVGGTVAFNQLFNMVALATDEIAGPALTALDGYRKATIALANQQLLNADSFAALTNNIGQVVTELEAQGKSHADVMLAIQPSLQTAWELQQKFGYKVDDTTQALIDEAVAAGAVGEEHKSTSEQMLDLMKQLVEAAEKIAEAFASPNGVTGSLVKVGDSAETNMARVVAAAKAAGLEVDKLGKGVVVDIATGGGSKPGFEGGTHGQYLDFGAGTEVVLHGRERVMTEEEGRSLPTEPLTFSPLARGVGSGGGARIAVNVDLRGSFLPDRQSISLLTRLIARDLPNKLRDQGLGI